MDYMTLKEASEKWGVTPRQINYLCASGRMVLWAVLLLLMSSNKKEMKSRKQANAKGKGKRAVRRKGR